MIKRALLFGGTDGHGIIMTGLSERALKGEGFEVTTVCSYIQPLPEKEQEYADYGTHIPCFSGSIRFPII